MATLFSALYSNIRSACGDHGAIKDGSLDSGTVEFRDDMIDSAIQLFLYELSGYSDDGSEGITPTIASDEDRLIIIYSVALMLLLGMEDLTIQTDIKITIGQGSKDLKIMNVASKLKHLLDVKTIPMATDSSKNAIRYLADRVIQEAT
jgi:hypothetical protein